MFNNLYDEDWCRRQVERHERKERRKKENKPGVRAEEYSDIDYDDCCDDSNLYQD